MVDRPTDGFTVAAASDERRADHRYLANEDAFMWDLLRIKAGYHSVTVVDLSRNGLRLEGANQLPAGSQIAVDFRGMIVCGTIRYCKTSSGGYTMGVRINDVLDPLQRHPNEVENTAEEQVGVVA